MTPAVVLLTHRHAGFLDTIPPVYLSPGRASQPVGSKKRKRERSSEVAACSAEDENEDSGEAPSRPLGARWQSESSETGDAVDTSDQEQEAVLR